MGFNEVILADIELEKGPAAVTPGAYVLSLLPGAQIRVNEYRGGEEELNLSFAIAEGEYSGRRLFASFPDPTAIATKGKNAGKPKTWSKQAMKKLQVSLGYDPNPGETPVDYFNRVAEGGNARVTATITNYTAEGKEPKAEISLFSFGPAA